MCDARETECRELRHKLETIKLSGVLDVRRAETKTGTVREELAACTKAKASLSSRVHRIEAQLRESAGKVTALEGQLQLAAEKEENQKLEVRRQQDELGLADSEAARAQENVRTFKLGARANQSAKQVEGSRGAAAGRRAPRRDRRAPPQRTRNSSWILSRVLPKRRN